MSSVITKDLDLILCQKQLLAEFEELLIWLISCRIPFFSTVFFHLQFFYFTTLVVNFIGPVYRLFLPHSHASLFKNNIEFNISETILNILLNLTYQKTFKQSIPKIIDSRVIDWKKELKAKKIFILNIRTKMHNIL